MSSTTCDTAGDENIFASRRTPVIASSFMKKMERVVSYIYKVLAITIIAGIIAGYAGYRFYEANAASVEAAAVNIYHEARGVRGPDDIGWKAVMASVINRVESEDFLSTFEEVIFQKRVVFLKGKKEIKCAYSWYCDGKSDETKDVALFREIKRETWWYMIEYRLGLWRDPTGGAHSYHSTEILPNSYFRRLEPKMSVIVPTGNGFKGHLFYGDS